MVRLDKLIIDGREKLFLDCSRCYDKIELHCVDVDTNESIVLTDIQCIFDFKFYKSMLIKSENTDKLFIPVFNKFDYEVSKMITKVSNDKGVFVLGTSVICVYDDLLVVNDNSNLSVTVEYLLRSLVYVKKVTEFSVNFYKDYIIVCMNGVEGVERSVLYRVSDINKLKTLIAKYSLLYGELSLY